MPELPEVETIRRDLGILIGQKISDLKILSPKTVTSGAAFLKKNLLNQKISKIARRGKLLIVAVANGYFLLIHLKMTGQLIYQDKKTKISGGHSLSSDSAEQAVGGSLPNGHTRAVFSFAGGGQLFFNDLRRFGYLKLVSKDELDEIIKNNYGPEPLSQEFTLKEFSKIFVNKRVNLKALLLNQKLIAGLGNIYVDECLFLAGIKPTRLAASIKPKELEKLFLAINDIIKKAIKYRGTTFSDYTDAKGHKGNFSSLLRVYGRAGQPCAICDRLVIKIKLAGRGTHYCEYCQK